MVEIEVMVAMVSPGGSSPVIRGCILKKTRMESAGIRRTNADEKEEKEKQRPSNFLLIKQNSWQNAEIRTCLV